MRIRMRSCRVMVATLGGAIFLGGCATLSVTPLQHPKPAAARQPVTLGILAAGERLRESLSDPDDSVVKEASGTLFERVIVLPPEARFKSAEELLASYGTDYVAAINISDVNVNGNLNPYWFVSLPLFFFKPLAPIVTFEATASLESTLRETRSGTVILQKEVSATVTDHFSPMEPQVKVRKLISLGINNAMVGLFGDFQQKIAGLKQKN
jgi:hypothetical protein